MCLRKMDTSDHATVDGKCFLHGPVLVKREMDHTPPLQQPRCGLEVNNIFDLNIASNSSPPSSDEVVKQETVIVVLSFSFSLRSSKLFTETNPAPLYIVSLGSFLLGQRQRAFRSIR